MLAELWLKIGKLWQVLRKANKGRRRWRAPYVRVMVLSNSPRRWSAPTDTDKWVLGVNKLRGSAFDTRLRLVYDVRDLYGLERSDYENFSVSASTRAFLFSMGKVRDPDLVDEWDAFRPVLAEAVREPDGEQKLRVLLCYLCGKGDKMTIEKEEALYGAAGLMFDPKIANGLVARKIARYGEWRAAEALKRGHQQGHQEGLQEGQVRGLAKALTRVVASKGISLSRNASVIINTCTDEGVLDDLFQRALTLNTGEPLLDL
jgi:hypothetical protein